MPGGERNGILPAGNFNGPMDPVYRSYHKNAQCMSSLIVSCYWYVHYHRYVKVIFSFRVCLSVVVSGYGCKCLCNVLGTCQSYSTSNPGQVIGYFTVYLCSYQHRVRGATAPYKFIFYGSQHLHTKKSLTVSVKAEREAEGETGKERKTDRQTESNCWPWYTGFHRQ